MELEAVRTGFRPDELEFRLGEIQKNTIRNNKVVAALEYSLKNQSIIEVPSNQPSGISAGSDIVFRFDKAYLASNSYLNRCKLIGEIEVKMLSNANFSGDGLAGAMHLDTAYPADLAANAGLIPTASKLIPRLFDNRNSAPVPFVLNKMLTRREIDFSGKAIQSQSFLDSNEIDEITCLYNQDTLETLGIYPEKVYGVNGDMKLIYGETPGKADYYDRAQSAVIAWGNNNEYLKEMPIYKRNTNGNYYRIVSSVYKRKIDDAVIGGYTFEYNGNNPVVASVQGTASYVELENIQGCPCPNVRLTAAGQAYITAGGTYTSGNDGAYQVVRFRIEEDMISDLFTNIYVNKPRYYAMNSSELNFRFSQSANMNRFFNTSNLPVNDTNGVSVSLKSLSLQFSTFNLGNIQVPFFNYEVPFFIQTMNQQKTTLDGNGNGTVSFPAISYSTIPHYIKIDNFIDEVSSTNPAKWISNMVGSTGITLKIDQDFGNSLQQMSYEELVRRTLANLGQFHQSWERVSRKMPNEWNYVALTGTTDSATNYRTNLQASMPVAVDVSTSLAKSVSSQPIVPFLLLKVGTDIRLAAGLEPGMRERVNMTFTMNMKNSSTPNGKLDVITKVVAYSLGKYVVSPVNGLLDTLEVSYSRDEWLKRLAVANNELQIAKNEGKMEHWVQEYQVPENMVLGGSWLSTLASNIGPVLTGIKHLAKFTHDMASRTGALHPAIPMVGRVAKATHQALDTLGFGEGGASGGRTRNVKYV